MKRLMMRSMLLGSFSAIAVLAGWAPNFSGQTANIFDSAAYAQEAPFTRYVRAAFDIEQTRKGLLEQMKQLTGGNVPSNVCQNVGQMNPGIRDQAKSICDTFAAQAKQIVARNGLKPDEFNTYQRQAQNPGMQQQIQDEARRIGLIK